MFKSENAFKTHKLSKCGMSLNFERLSEGLIEMWNDFGEFRDEFSMLK